MLWTLRTSQMRPFLNTDMNPVFVGAGLWGFGCLQWGLGVSILEGRWTGAHWLDRCIIIV